MGFLLSLIFLLSADPARAEYRICGKFLECGVFAGDDLMTQDGPKKSIRIFEFKPGVVSFMSFGDDPMGDNTVFTLEFEDDGHFTVKYWQVFEIGEGSCQNMICQFKIDDSKWVFGERPVMKVSGTVTFANGHISRTEVRKSGDAVPFFVTGVLESWCASPARLLQFSASGKATPESCLYWLEGQTRVNLGKAYWN